MTRLNLKSFCVPLCGAFGVLATPAHAQVMTCGGYAQITAPLAATYSEIPLGNGVASDKGDRMEIWVNPDTGTWTLVLVQKAMTCVKGAGIGWVFGEMGDPA